MSKTNKLAILGGRPVRTRQFPEWPVHDKNEIKAIHDVVKSGKWWRGAYSVDELGSDSHVAGVSKVELFEDKFSSCHGAQYGVATSSGLGALDIAVKALGIGPGDEVIVPPYTFIATATCILHNNAVPVFVDIDPETYNLDVEKIEEAITDNTKALIPVHFGGNLVDMKKLCATAEKYNLKVIEDAAHAHGVEWSGKKMAGSMGNMGMFSFQQSKNMTAGEGGIVITNDEGLYDLCYSIHDYGRVRGKPWYEIHRLGWNERMTEFQAAILIEQLERLDSLNSKRTMNAQYLTQCLYQIEGVDPLKVESNMTKCSYHLYIFKYDPAEFEGVHRDNFLRALNAEGIPATTGYNVPIYSNPMFQNSDWYPKNCPVECQFYGSDIDYRDFKAKCPAAEKACSSEAVWLTQNILLGEKEDMDSIVEAIQKVKIHIGELRGAI